jgi:hypothetical protein
VSIEEINNALASVDDNGFIRVPLPASRLSRIDAEKHRRACFKNLPPLNGVTEEDSEENRKLLAYYVSCCGIWYRPKIHYSDFGSYWVWKRVSSWRLRRWRRKGLI